MMPQASWNENVHEKMKIAQYISQRKHENENCTISIQKGNSYCRLKRSAKGLGLKSHLKTTTRNWHINMVTHPNTNRANVQCKQFYDKKPRQKYNRKCSQYYLGIIKKLIWFIGNLISVGHIHCCCYIKSSVADRIPKKASIKWWFEPNPQPATKIN